VYTNVFYESLIRNVFYGTKDGVVNKKLLSSYCYQLCKKGKAVWVSQSIEKFRR